MEKIFYDYPKFLGMTEDLHAIATYLNDLRLTFFALTATAYAVGMALLVLKLCQSRRKNDCPCGQHQSSQDEEWNSEWTDTPYTVEKRESNSRKSSRETLPLRRENGDYPNRRNPPVITFERISESDGPPNKLSPLG